ncbi:MAG TPA: hypothetical protein VNH11_08750, partial [Pirellulales bacterium]|nr:hypothetical protein [Pirellulales bacterium]
MSLPCSSWRKLREWWDSLCEAIRATLEVRGWRRPGVGRFGRAAQATRRRRPKKPRRPRNRMLRMLIYEGLEARRVFSMEPDGDWAVITGLSFPKTIYIDEQTAYVTVDFGDTDSQANPPIIDGSPESFSVVWNIAHSSGTEELYFQKTDTDVEPSTDTVGFPVDGLGYYTISVAVTDVGEGGTSSVLTAVCVASPPTDVNVGQYVPPTSTGPAPIVEGAGGAFTVGFIDNDDPPHEQGGEPDSFSYSWVATDDNGTTLATAVTPDPSYYYAAGEATHVNLACTVIDDDGLSATGSTSFDVGGVPPSNVQIATPASAHEWDTLTLTGTFDDFDAVSDTFNYNWSVNGPGGAVNGTANGNAYTFAAGEGDGTYNAQFIVTDDDNLSATGTASFIVTGIPPTNVGVSANPAAVYEYQSLTLAGSFSDVDKSSSGESFTYSWTVKDPNGDDFASGSGLTLTLQAGSIPGTYTASFTVTDDDNLSASGSGTFLVNPPSITAYGYGIFDIKDVAFDDNVASFSESHAYGGHSYQAFINWGDGQTSGGTVIDDGSDPAAGTATGHVTGEHEYQQEGVYAITVMIVDQNYYFDKQLDYLIGFGESFAKIAPTDEDEYVETAAASGYNDVFIGANSGTPNFSAGTYSTGVSGGPLIFTYIDALTETYATALDTQIATLDSMNASAQGTFNGKSPSLATFSVATYTAGDSGSQAFTRAETYADLGVYLVKTDTGGGAISDNKNYSSLTYTWTQNDTDNNADLETGVVLLIAPPPGEDETPEEVDEFLQQLDDAGVVGPFTFSGTDNITTNLSEGGYYAPLLDPGYTRTTTITDIQANTQTGGQGPMIYTQVDSENDADTIVEMHATDTGEFTISEASTNTAINARNETNQSLATADNSTNVVSTGIYKTGTEEGTYTLTQTVVDSTDSTVVETDQTDTTSTVTNGTDTKTTVQTGDAGSGIYGAGVGGGGPTTVIVEESNQGFSANSTATTIASETETRGGNDYTGDYNFLVDTIDDTTSNEVDTNQTDTTSISENIDTDT